MSRILFVDDEPRVLEGLRRTLHGVRRQCEMEFVLSGQEALDRLATSPFDAVVCDVRMPGMDGSELLEQVMKRFPTAVRIILSGQCHRQAALKTVGPAHQFFTKPCDSETLGAAVERACRLRDRLKNAECRQLVSQVRCVPSSPAAHSALAAELESAKPSAERLGEIVSRDVALTANLLRLVSSGFFGSPQKSSDPARWTALLGIETIRLLVGSAGAIRPMEADHPSMSCLEPLGEHSRKVARWARAIAAAETGDATLAGHACLGGLLHDVGQLVLADHLPQCHADTWARSRAERIPVWEAEDRCLGATHADLGGYLLGLWGAPDAVVDAVLFHHRPSLSSGASFSPLAAVHVASAAADAAELDIPLHAAPVDVEYVKRIGCAERLGPWFDICQTTAPHEVAS